MPIFHTRDTIHPDPATPLRARSVSSYPARRLYRPGVVHPPGVPGVKGMIDIHCHAHEGQQDALSLSKLASQNGMAALLFKTIGPMSHASYEPGKLAQQIQNELNRWADDQKVAPIHCLAGYGLTMDNRPPSVQRLRSNLADGVAAVWLPVFNHANTLYRVGGKRIWWDESASQNDHSQPLPWNEAIRCGYYLLNEQGRLKPEFEECLRVVVDADVALFFGHCTHPEIEAVADFLLGHGHRKAVIDHPFSPFIDLSLTQMQQLTQAGITLNFTYDELSPLLGVDPAKMYEAIRSVSLDYITLSSDAGEPLFPNSVECMRLISGYMAAFGLSAEEIHTTCCVNPGRIAGLPVNHSIATSSFA